MLSSVSNSFWSWLGYEVESEKTLDKEKIMESSPESSPDSSPDSYPELTDEERMGVIWKELSEHVFCISLEECFERRIQTNKEFQKVGLDVNYKLVKRDLEDPVRGCYTSHLDLVKHAYENNWERMLVFEDDVCFEPSKLVEDALVNIRLFIHNTPETMWNVIFMGHSAIKPLYKISFNMVSCDKGLRLTHALLWSRSGMELFLKQEYNRNHVDYVIGSLGRNYAPLPMIAYQKDFKTTLADKKFTKYYILSRLRDIATQKLISRFLQSLFLFLGNVDKWYDRRRFN